jgi:hypothetical protein
MIGMTTTMTSPKRKRPKADPSKLSLSEIVVAVEQLYVREKYELYMALRHDSALKAYRELKLKQRERVRQQTARGKRRAA